MLRKMLRINIYVSIYVKFSRSPIFNIKEKPKVFKMLLIYGMLVSNF